MTLTLLTQPVGGGQKYFANDNIDIAPDDGDAPDINLDNALRYDAAQGAVVLRANCNAARGCPPRMDFVASVRASRPGLAWDPDVFRMAFRVVPTEAEDSAPWSVATEAADAVGRGLITFALHSAFADAQFAEVSDSADLFTVALNGEVRLSGSSAPAAGLYGITVAATAPARKRGVRSFHGVVQASAQIRILSSGGIAFAGAALANNGDSAALELPNIRGVLSSYSAIYRGTRRGLHWVESGAAIENFQFYNYLRQLPQRFCAAGGESGGKRWRLPTLSEVAGILSDGTGEIPLAEVNRDYEIPGAANGISVPLPSVARGGAKNLTGDAFVVPPLDRNRGGRSEPAMYEFSGGQAKLFGYVPDLRSNCVTINNITACSPPGFEYVEPGDRCEYSNHPCLLPRLPLGPDARIACVLETDSAADTPPLLGARVEVNGQALAGGAISLTVRAPTTPAPVTVALPEVITAAGPVITVRAVGWNFRDDNGYVAVQDHPNAPMSLSVRAPQGFSVQIENNAGAVVHLDETPDLYAETDISIAAWPQFGATVSLILQVATGSPDDVGPPITDAELAALLPPAQRNARVLVPAQNPDLDPALAPGFTGVVHRLVPGAGGALQFAPAASAGMTLLANGVISLTSALNAGDPAQTAVFTLTANMEGAAAPAGFDFRDNGADFG